MKVAKELYRSTYYKNFLKVFFENASKLSGGIC